ncbi:MAG: glycoside hydrolase family 125 protein [Bacilli bacterium]
MTTKQQRQSIAALIEKIQKQVEQHPKFVAIFEKCFDNTLTTTVKKQQDGTTYVITGDIPAMWLRDSVAQVRPYLLLANEDKELSDMIAGLVERQFQYILMDPYANAFNESANGNGHQTDETTMQPIVWERKYEIDSLCYPLQLAYLLWKATGRTDHFNETYEKAVAEIIKLWRIEQDHEIFSDYRFQRVNSWKYDNLDRDGLGKPVKHTGMTWSGFRPSDDSCTYGYLVPANMFVVVVLRYVAQIADTVLRNDAMKECAEALAQDVHHGIETYAVYNHPTFGEIYAYETDGYGNFNLMDDANVPSLLSMPYLGYCDENDVRYQNTRRFILSEENPFYYAGTAAQGIGSPHTPERHIWHISLAMQGLTTADKEEKLRILKLMSETDADTFMMHEGFHVDDPTDYSREWFSWANMMFCELLLDYCGITVQK